MPRQFKVEVDYLDVPQTKLFWHDNDVIEFTTIPPTNNTSSLIHKTEILSMLINFMKTDNVSKVECTRLS